MSVTIKDIARYCNVSIGTVDRAVNGRGGINPITKQRIMEAKALLGYKPHRIAQSLARGKSMSVGLICFDLTNNFIATLIDVIEHVAKRKGYYINLVLTHGDGKEERAGIDFLVEHMVDGIIVFPVGYGEEYADYIKNLSVPVVTIYNKLSDEIPFIGINAREAMRQAVRHMGGLGYERIILVNARLQEKMQNGNNVFTLLERQKGYLNGIAELNRQDAPAIVEGLDFERLDGYLREFGGYKTSILCICDMYALEVLEHCKANGLSVPEDVGLMGFDNMPTLKYVTPRIASVGYNVEEMAARAFDVLLKMMEMRPVDSGACCLDFTLEAGQSL
jgi:DNA-binding LacI/PurR family transcriptional regulator